MENIEVTADSEYLRSKRLVIKIAFALIILSSPLPLILGEKTSAAQLVDFLSIIGLNMLVFAWCHYDSLQRNQPFGKGWGFSILLFGSLALIIYLFKSRGFKQGAVSVGKALLIFLAMILGSTLAMLITVLVLGIEP